MSSTTKGLFRGEANQWDQKLKQNKGKKNFKVKEVQSMPLRTRNRGYMRRPQNKDEAD
jgi:hypothetical protein